MIKTKYNICIICEGEEEFDYLNQLKSFNVWSNIYSIKFRKALSIDNIAIIYQYVYSNYNYDLVLVFCDTEVEPYGQYKKMKENISSIYGNKNAVDHVVFFANPNSMQIILSHFDSIKLQSNDKSKNSFIIEKLTGVEDYRATEKQRTSIMRKINADNYEILKTNLAKLGTNDTTTGSTNFLTLLQYLESDDPTWIEDIIHILEED